MPNLGRKEAEIVFIRVMFAFSAYKLLDAVLLQLSNVPDIPVIGRGVGAVKQDYFSSLLHHHSWSSVCAGPLQVQRLCSDLLKLSALMGSRNRDPDQCTGKAGAVACFSQKAQDE